MKIIDVPVYNADGSVQFTASITPEQAQHLLGFAYSFLVASGLTFHKMLNLEEPTEAPVENKTSGNKTLN